MARFTFEVCKQDQVTDLVKYIDERWAKNHILVTSRELLDWQHKNVYSGDYNFVMARHNKSGEICGVLGFIPTSHFSAELESEKEVWLAIWKVNEGPKYIGLGLGLLNFLKREFSINNICSIGISPIVYPMYQTLGYVVGRMNHMVLLNDTISEYRIAKVSTLPFKVTTKKNSYYRVEEIDESQISSLLSDPSLYDNKTKKDGNYFAARFLSHPKFRYRFIGIYNGTKLEAFLVVRVVEHDSSTALRVVDVQGKHTIISEVTMNLHDLIINEGHEYLDLMQYGMDVDSLIDAGFMLVDPEGELIIPDYFQPFVQKNIPMHFARYSQEKEASFVLFKGDSDQDRPNRM
ncbi:hypothetical protein AB6D20_000725 [Vibrio splendidus]|uniref:hypothetical protein n=1 Tax=Vibrio cyclitrophicus TaxID=47951 RepID=UPI000C8386FC|nr:hypothetical protein [Vibrio cyclitrophicus]PMI45219.1 hypothetical protein BCU44_01170 [Vibrio cyclitrophicus]